MLLSELLNEYILELQIKNCSEQTIKSYRNNLLRFINYLEDMSLKEVKSIHIKEYILHLQSLGRKGTYINTIIKQIRGLFNYAVEEEYINNNIASKVRWLKEITPVIETFNEDEIKAMLGYYKGKDFLSVRNRLIVNMLLDTGMRAGELTNIKLQDLNGNSLLVHGKGRKERMLTISPALMKLIMKYLRVRSARKVESEYLFVSCRHNKLCVETIEEVFRGMKHLVRPNIRCSPHVCRHYNAQFLLKNGVDVYVISKLLGHESLLVTKRYLNSLPSEELARLSISPVMALSK